MADQEKIIRFMNVRHLAGVVSLIFILASLVSLATQGLNLGLDFTGGTLKKLSSMRLCLFRNCAKSSILKVIKTLLSSISALKETC